MDVTVTQGTRLAKSPFFASENEIENANFLIQNLRKFWGRPGRDGLLKWIDLPPVWLLGALSLAWLQAENVSAGLNFGGAWADFVGGLLVGAGLLLMAFAILEMRRFKTTVIPHQEAGHLVTSGIFKRTRNPIYLGDALVLAGLILRWDAVLSLPLVPIFVWIIERRFILPEEDRLRRKFRLNFEQYCRKTRRWV